jgi:hypothetical protein
MKAIRESGATSIHSLPDRTTGHDFLHSCRHFWERVSLAANFEWEVHMVGCIDLWLALQGGNPSQ